MTAEFLRKMVSFLTTFVVVFLVASELLVVAGRVTGGGNRSRRKQVQSRRQTTAASSLLMKHRQSQNTINNKQKPIYLGLDDDFFPASSYRRKSIYRGRTEPVVTAREDAEPENDYAALRIEEDEPNSDDTKPIYVGLSRDEEPLLALIPQNGDNEDQHRSSGSQNKVKKQVVTIAGQQVALNMEDEDLEQAQPPPGPIYLGPEVVNDQLAVEKPGRGDSRKKLLQILGGNAPGNQLYLLPMNQKSQSVQNSANSIPLELKTFFPGKSGNNNNNNNGGSSSQQILVLQPQGAQSNGDAFVPANVGGNAGNVVVFQAPGPRAQTSSQQRVGAVNYLLATVPTQLLQQLRFPVGSALLVPGNNGGQGDIVTAPQQQLQLKHYRPSAVNSEVVPGDSLVIQAPIPLQPMLPAKSTSTQQPKIIGAVNKMEKAVFNCNGKKWMVPVGIYDCCGEALFKVKTEACARGNIVVGRNQLSSQSKINIEMAREQWSAEEEQEYEQPPEGTKMLQCQGHRYAVPVADAMFYGCCGKRAIFWPQEQCDAESISGDSYTMSGGQRERTSTSPNTREVNTLLVCDGVSHWVPSSQRFFWGCCGKQKYDVRHDRCNSNDMDNSLSATLSDGKSCPADHICCSPYSTVLNVARNLKCCPGDSAPTPIDQRCSFDKK